MALLQPLEQLPHLAGTLSRRRDRTRCAVAEQRMYCTQPVFRFGGTA
jgi:hypothetical protein